MTEDDCKQMITEHAAEGETALNFEEFVRMIMAK